jgi:PAS domain S-box-containing protein
MVVLQILPPTPMFVGILLDATLLSSLLFPIFYYLVFRPLSSSITRLKRAEDDLRVAAVAFEIKDPTLITDADANIIRANKKFLNIIGYSLEELIGNNPRMLKSGRHNQAFYEQMWKQLIRTGSWSGEMRVKSKAGHVNPFWLTITAVKNEQKETTHYIGIYNFG